MGAFPSLCRLVTAVQPTQIELQNCARLRYLAKVGDSGFVSRIYLHTYYSTVLCNPICEHSGHLGVRRPPTWDRPYTMKHIHSSTAAPVPSLVAHTMYVRIW